MHNQHRRMAMRKSCLLTIAGSIFLSGIFVTALFQSSTAVAEMSSSGEQSGTQSSKGEQSGDNKGTGIPKSPQECVKDKGCLSQTASGQTSIQGTTCSTGMVCTNPGASCSLNGMKCRTYDFGG